MRPCKINPSIRVFQINHTDQNINNNVTIDLMENGHYLVLLFSITDFDYSMAAQTQQLIRR